MKRLLFEICLFLTDLFYGLVDLFFLIARKVRGPRVGILLLMSLLPACTLPPPQTPKGFLCWPDKGYIVCQFVGAEQGKADEAR